MSSVVHERATSKPYRIVFVFLSGFVKIVISSAPPSRRRPRAAGRIHDKPIRKLRDPKNTTTTTCNRLPAVLSKRARVCVCHVDYRRHFAQCVRGSACTCVCVCVYFFQYFSPFRKRDARVYAYIYIYIYILCTVRRIYKTRYYRFITIRRVAGLFRKRPRYVFRLR